MRAPLLSIVVTLSLIAAARADGPSSANWIGRYTPISKVCAKLTLVVVPGKLSFGDCSRVAFQDLTVSAGMAAHIDDKAACKLAGKVLTLTPDGSDVNTLSIYDSEQAWRNAQPNLVCAYSR